MRASEARSQLVQESARDELELVPHAGLVVQNEVVEAVDALLARHRRGRRANLPELGDGHLKGSLVWLVGGPERVVAARLAAHLDVAAQHVRDCAALGESDQPIEAGEELREIERVQTAG